MSAYELLKELDRQTFRKDAPLTDQDRKVRAALDTCNHILMYLTNDDLKAGEIYGYLHEVFAAAALRALGCNVREFTAPYLIAYGIIAIVDDSADEPGCDHCDNSGEIVVGRYFDGEPITERCSCCTRGDYAYERHFDK